jgi:hypothetical protein
VSSDPLKGASVPAPRPVRSHYTGFSIPWQMLRQGALHFQRRMNAARANHADPMETWHWDTYALATQVFAAMAAEALLNTYGLVRFEPDLLEKLQWTPSTVKRLKRMVALGAGIQLQDSDALVRTLASLMEKRNPIVHMQANEEVFDHDGHIIRPAPPPPDHLAGANAAVQEMETFLRGFAELIGHHDIESWTYVAPW